MRLIFYFLILSFCGCTTQGHQDQIVKKYFECSSDSQGQYFLDIGEHSSSIHDVHISLRLPKGYKLLKKAKNKIEIFTFEQIEPVQTLFMDDLNQHFVLNRKFHGEHLWLQGKFYYCPILGEGLCYIHEVFMEATLKKDLEPADLVINYQLPLEN